MQNAFWELPKFFTCYALDASYYRMLVLCSNMNDVDIKNYCLNVLSEYLHYKKGLLGSIYVFHYILNVLLERIEMFN